MGKIEIKTELLKPILLIIEKSINYKSSWKLENIGDRTEIKN